VLVADVVAGGPADKAGLKRGDVILKLGAKDLANSSELKTRLYEADPSQALNLAIWRAGEKLGLRVEPSALQAARDSGRWHGLEVEPNSAALAAKRGLASDRGVVVSAVAAKSTGDQIGMKPGDLLLTVNQQPVDSLADWRKVTEAVDERQDAVILLVRGRQSAYVVLPAEE
jgi:serine protease Do